MEIDVPKIDQFLEEQMVNTHGHGGGGGNGHLQYERNLNFATVAVEDNEYGFPKKKTVRDPLSHRIIEKRRRDRMNNCLADLARLLPASSLRKGRGRIEKTEIVELAIKHLKHLQTHPCPQSDECEFTQMARSQKKTSSSSSGSSRSSGSNHQDDNFRLGYQECLSEALHFLVETEGMYPGDDLCVRLMKHLNSHCENLMRDHLLRNNGKHSVFSSNSQKIMEVAESFKNKESCSAGSSSSGYQATGSSSGSDANGGNDGEGSLTNESFTLPPASHHFNSSERMSNTFDYEGDNDNNSCSSTLLSVEITDVLSTDGKNSNRSSNKPPIPAIFGGGNSSNNSGSPAVLSSSNGRSSDEGSSSLHRYKFKNNIKRRFNADLQTKYGADEDNYLPQENGASVEDTDQNMEDSECKLDSAGNLQRNSSSNSSNTDSEPATCADITSPATISSSHNVTSISAGLPTISPALIPSSDEKQVVDHFDQKPTTEELQASAKLLDCENVALVPKTSMPIINATSLLSSGQEIPPLPLPLPTTGALGSTGVPAFALHDKGLYYIPLTIDKSIVSPFIAAMEPNTQPPLHPVTISVCFLLSAGETPGKLKSPPIILSKELNPAVPVSVPITIPLPMNIAPIVPLLKPPKGTSKDHSTNFIMNRFTQSQQCNPKIYSGRGNTSSSGYRYPPGISGDGSSASSGSYSPNNLVTYPLLYGTSPPGTINFGHHGAGGHNNNGSGSHHHHNGSNHHNSSYHSGYYNHSSSSASNCSGGNNSDNNSWGKNVRSSNSSGSTVGMGRDGNNPAIHVSNSNGNSSTSSGNGSLDSKGSSSSGSSSGNSGHLSSRSSGGSSTGICPSSRQSRKRSISSSPSVSGSALSTSTGYHSWHDKASSSSLSVSSADNSYQQHSHGISLALNDQQINYNDVSNSTTHHYGHLHPHVGHRSHGHSHIHPQYSSHGHSHSHGHAMSHNHGIHHEDKEQDRAKGRLSPNKRAKKCRTLEQEMQHKHNLSVQERIINR